MAIAFKNESALNKKVQVGELGVAQYFKSQVTE